jgi:pimeloyl-ACP methyl ester carboxylesterase
MDKVTFSQASITSLQIEIKGRRVHYLKAGKGPAVVLVHGGASDSRDWLRTMAQYGDRFSFYAPDLPGFGKSDRDEKGYYLYDFSDFLQGFIELLKIESPVLVGHSFGARLCLDTVRKQENNISKLILIDASGLGKMSPPGMVMFGFFTVLRKALRQPQPFPKFLTKEGDNWDYIGDEVLTHIKVPTLLIWKRTDPYLPVSIAQKAVKLIPGAKLEIVEGYGHAPHQQNDNSAFNKLFLDFLSPGDQEKA